MAPASHTNPFAQEVPSHSQPTFGSHSGYVPAAQASPPALPTSAPQAHSVPLHPSPTPQLAAAPLQSHVPVWQIDAPLLPQAGPVDATVEPHEQSPPVVALQSSSASHDVPESPHRQPNVAKHSGFAPPSTQAWPPLEPAVALHKH